MSKRKDGQERGKYTLEFKQEAVRMVKGGQAVPVTDKIMVVPTRTLGDWVRLNGKGQLKGAGTSAIFWFQAQIHDLFSFQKLSHARNGLEVGGVWRIANVPRKYQPQNQSSQTIQSRLIKKTDSK